MKKVRKTILRVVLLAMAVHLWCGAQLRTELWQVSSARVPEAFDGFRISLLTDIHGRAFGENSEKLLSAVAQQAPDLIAISGDLVDEASRLSVLEPMLTGLCRIAPVYYVTGNHEWSRDDTLQILDMISDTGVTVLRNTWQVLEKDGAQIVVAGADDPNGHADRVMPKELMEKIRQQISGDPYVVMLYHRNNSLDLWAELETDLVLAGHGHGGVIRLPLVGGLLGVDREFFPDDCEGLYTKGRTTLAVSCGLGGVRLWNRPHLPVVELKSVNNS